MAICNNNKCSLGECNQSETCTAFIPVMTNADRIRAMSDEELGKFLCSLMTADNCWTTCPASSLCSHGKTGMVEWMKLPAKEDDNG